MFAVFLFLILLAAAPAHACEGFLPPVHPTGWATGIVTDVIVTPDSVDSIVTHITLAVGSSYRNALPDTVTFSSAGGTILGGNETMGFAERVKRAKVLLHPVSDPPDTAIPGQSFSITLGEWVWIAYYIEDGKMRVYDLCLILPREYRDLIVSDLMADKPFSAIPTAELLAADRTFKQGFNLAKMSETVTYRTFSHTVYEAPDPSVFEPSLRQVAPSQRWLYYRTHLLQPKQEGSRLDSLIAATEAEIANKK